jgi:hypothetical protein
MKPECPKKNHRSVAIHWHTWSKYKTGGNIPKQKAEHDPAMIGSDCIGSYKSDYHAFTTAHYWIEICKTNFIFLKYMSCWTHWRAYISKTSKGFLNDNSSSSI